SASPSTASTRTTWRSCWTRRASPCGPVTTAPSRCTSASASSPRPGRRSTCTRPRPRSTRSSRGSATPSRTSEPEMDASNVDAMYQEIILDHYKNPHGAGLREPFEAEVHHVNPTCGDEITLRVHLDGGRVADVSYAAEGCSISQASASVMNELLVGKSVEEGLQTLTVFQELMQGRGQVEPDEDVLEDGIAFAGVAQFPARVKCALLAWMAWKDAVAQASEIGRA